MRGRWRHGDAPVPRGGTLPWALAPGCSRRKVGARLPNLGVIRVFATPLWASARCLHCSSRGGVWRDALLPPRGPELARSACAGWGSTASSPRRSVRRSWLVACALRRTLRGVLGAGAAWPAWPWVPWHRLPWCSAREAARRRARAPSSGRVPLPGWCARRRQDARPAVSYVGSLGDARSTVPVPRSWSRAVRNGGSRARGEGDGRTRCVELMVCALSVSARTGAPLQGLFLRSARLAERRFELEREPTARSGQAVGAHRERVAGAARGGARARVPRLSCGRGHAGGALAACSWRHFSTSWRSRSSGDS